ncbi:IGEB protein, partial [Caloenas nicobarica]|nr:IGEB protein [Caloenas nicobarica]
VKHVTGIPHSPMGQGIIERAHQMIKGYLNKQKEREELDCQQRLAKVLFTLNYLSLNGNNEEPPIIILHHYQIRLGRENTLPEFMVRYRDPVTGIWKGP